MVATKAALSIRVDALTDAEGKSDESSATIGIQNRTKLESRLRALEHQSDTGNVNRFSQNGNKKQARFSMGGETKTYNTKADAVDFVSTQRDNPMEAAVKAVLDVKEEKKRAKEEKKAKKAQKEAQKEDVEKMDVDGQEAEDMESKKEKKRKRRESEIPTAEEPAQVRTAVNVMQPITDLSYFQEETEEERKARKQAKKDKKAEKAAAAASNDSPKKKKKKSE
jgi:nucleolar protein 58